MLVRRKMLLDNRVAIITGGARGIGKGIALKFAEEGCSVAIADIQIKEAEKTVLEILDKGVQALAIECDATNSSQVQDSQGRKRCDGFSTFSFVNSLVRSCIY